MALYFLTGFVPVKWMKPHQILQRRNCHSVLFRPDVTDDLVTEIRDSLISAPHVEIQIDIFWKPCVFLWKHLCHCHWSYSMDTSSGCHTETIPHHEPHCSFHAVPFKGRRPCILSSQRRTDQGFDRLLWDWRNAVPRDLYQSKLRVRLELLIFCHSFIAQ